ncbi:MAG: hypothetical protein JWP97_4598 [Labilithrix sp.]|nr:hypothetical protein [Labilithrix sp.]
MKNSKLVAIALLSLVAAYGCTSPTEDDAADPDAVSEDQLILGKGSVDQAAIVESTTMQLIDGPGDFPTTLDAYNKSDPFAIAPGDFRSGFAKNLAKFDAEDGVKSWTAAQSAAWTKRMSEGNYQVVDLSKPCDYAAPHSYLEIERAQLTGRAHTTCGGRSPNEDAFDVTINFLVRGPAASVGDADALHDGVTQATKKAAATFPYLAEMN